MSSLGGLTSESDGDSCSAGGRRLRAPLRRVVEEGEEIVDEADGMAVVSPIQPATAVAPRKSRANVRRRLIPDDGSDPHRSQLAAAAAAAAAAATSALPYADDSNEWSSVGPPSKRRRGSIGSSVGESPSGARRAPGSGASRGGGDAQSRADKGFRLFSRQVCEVVQRQNITTYSKVADELVDELAVGGDSFVPGSGSSAVSVGKAPDEKNIRRRTYDALNVLEAIGAITKAARVITWAGLPDQVVVERERVQWEKRECASRIARKRAQLSDLLVRQVCLKNLIEHNARNERARQDAQASTMQFLHTQATTDAPEAQTHSLAAPAAAGVKLEPMTPTKTPAPSRSMLASPSRPSHLSSRYASLLTSPLLQSRHASPFRARLHNAMLASSGLSPGRSSHVGGGGDGLPSTPSDGASLEGTTRGAAVSVPCPAPVSAPPPSLPIPFLLLYTASDNVLHVEQSDDREEVIIHISGSFALHEFWDLLRALNMHHVNAWDLPRFLASRDLCRFYPPSAVLHATGAEHDPNQMRSALQLRA